MKVGVSETLYQAALLRMNYTFQLDAGTEKNIRNALDEAQAYLRKEAGNQSLTFEAGDLRTLLLDCAWYLINHKKADFCREYSGELTTLRLMEGFGCGKETDTV